MKYNPDFGRLFGKVLHRKIHEKIGYQIAQDQNGRGYLVDLVQIICLYYNN